MFFANKIVLVVAFKKLVFLEFKEADRTLKNNKSFSANWHSLVFHFNWYLKCTLFSLSRKSLIYFIWLINILLLANILKLKR